MPATRLDIYQPVGSTATCGHIIETPTPTTYDGPLCWIPRQLDSSAGGQVFVNRDDFGPLSGHLLHMSFGAAS
ncbi:MAG: hypothetical protein R3B90_11330 [Planctomycetaceae bacterium]